MVIPCRSEMARAGDRLGRALDGDATATRARSRRRRTRSPGRQHQDDADDRHVPAEARGNAAGDAGEDPVLPASVEAASSAIGAGPPAAARVLAMWVPTRASCFPPRWP